MRQLLILVILLFSTSCSQKKTPIKGETEFQIKMNSEFKDASKSPLKPEDLKSFDGLDFFDFDEEYKVMAQLERTPDAPWFQMKTTTERLSKERVFGIASFSIGDREFQLNIYQGEENMNTEGLEDYLFLPFLDLTNGESTYGGGRYINLRIPEGATIEIDFNSAYNPLCVYNEKYSCPIVPRTNFMDTEIRAGVKMFNKK
ncbi:DUF1684 domain-containing protein [Winogradskyella aurantiaca]|uniref:DUF1684 domain-containing protein n=1 Tax=Winogradskyella aurantiaca TaxID=2219558 RepID=UPI000E1D330E|nr:DUF1684 domain-containing protein [Winogradskyella aurantiaca]